MTAAAPAAPAPSTPVKDAPYFVEKVLWVKHWTDRLFSFAITRPASFRFRSGEFVMIGLPPREELGGKKPILRAYSIGSPSFAEELEFFSIKVPDGPLTSRLQQIQEGDEILLGKKPTGTLVLDAVRPGKRLFLFGTGTGLAPWLSVARDPDAYSRFERVIVAHGVREVKELAYRDLFTHEIFDDPLVGDEARAQLTYYPTVTREPFERQGRFTDLIESGKLFSDLGLEGDKFDPEHDRAMLCGSMAMIKDTAALLEAHGLKEGSNAEPGDFVIERAFVG
ncbi:ferredoxin--NADP reductase [Caulobacter segnis]|uniref:ferredoxin--NADP(+) reductase n=1 Tax=Caulobacter segnis (strain ATCC 21756 / DSM 7131 / JCM 7823 / NBRC 15250 / LMG 17158 / TK0059) TaxID=509190 RepID=D5VHX4_CAUST|nr:ferredoxin--NADP reductase [Caulobacter segnis]ADG09227.1 Ferredoxin--NADP(+) reductase [Caulobacter segnis ATCC 21756]